MGEEFGGGDGPTRGLSADSAAAIVGRRWNSSNFLPQFPSRCCRDELRRGWMGSNRRAAPAGLDKTSSQHHKSFPPIHPPEPTISPPSLLPDRFTSTRTSQFTDGMFWFSEGHLG